MMIRSFLLCMAVPAFIYGDNNENFQAFLEKELEDCEKDLNEFQHKVESGLDVAQYYYFMGKQCECNYILKQWESMSDENIQGN